MKFLGVSLVLMWVVEAVAQSTPLEMKAVYVVEVPARSVEEPQKAGRKLEDSLRTITISIYLTNRSTETIRVPCRVPLDHFSAGREETAFYLTFRIPQHPPDMDLRVPESDLAIVELRPNQTALVSFTETLSEEHLKKIKVVYEIGLMLAEQHRLWQGRVEVFAEPWTQPKKKPNQSLQPTGASARG